MKKIIILGCGALGSQTLSSLVPDLRGEVDITILDFDKIEDRNINAGTQFFMRDQVGLFKTEALQYNLYKWFNRRIGFVNEILTPENSDRLLSGYDLVVDALDNYNARKVVQDWWVRSRSSCLHCGFSQNMTFEVCWAENYEVPSDITSGFDICELEGAASFIKMVGAVSASTIINFLKNGEKKDFLGNRFVVTELK